MDISEKVKDLPAEEKELVLCLDYALNNLGKSSVQYSLIRYQDFAMVNNYNSQVYLSMIEKYDDYLDEKNFTEKIDYYF